MSVLLRITVREPQRYSRSRLHGFQSVLVREKGKQKDERLLIHTRSIKENLIVCQNIIYKTIVVDISQSGMLYNMPICPLECYDY